jgi:hypothetical protein
VPELREEGMSAMLRREAEKLRLQMSRAFHVDLDRIVIDYTKDAEGKETADVYVVIPPMGVRDLGYPIWSVGFGDLVLRGMPEPGPDPKVMVKLDLDPKGDE